MSKVDLDSHFKLPHMVGLLEKISYLLAKPLVLESYEEVRGEVCDYLSYQPNTVDAKEISLHL